MATENLLTYYAQRAHEYDQIYERPERQPDLHRLRSWLQDTLAGHRILEIACGTGYWTEAIASAAAAITATDGSPDVLELARHKNYPAGRVQFAVSGAYALEHVDGAFTAGLAAFWWSHVPRERREEFLRGLHRRLGVGAVIVLMDNRYVKGNSTAISRRDARGNTYQLRRLTDGTTHEVLKNFPTLPELDTIFAPISDDLSVAELTYYWRVRYRVASAA